MKKQQTYTDTWYEQHLSRVSLQALSIKGTGSYWACFKITLSKSIFRLPRKALHPHESHKGKTLPLPWGWGIEVLGMVMSI